MKEINDQPGMGQHFPHGFGIALIHIAAHGVDRLFQPLGDRAQKFQHGFLLSIRQDPQNRQATVRLLAGHDDQVVSLTLLRRDLIQPRGSPVD